LVDATQVLQYFANGVSFGAILALAAIGLSLVYGILNLSNFAHGDLVALGAFGVLLFGKLMFDDLPLIAIGLPLVILAAVGVDAAWTRKLSRAERLSLGTRTTTLVLVVATLVAVAAVCSLLLVLELAIWRPLRRKRATTLTLIIVSIGLALVVRNWLLLRFGGQNQGFNMPALPSDSFGGVLVSDAQQFTIVAALVIIAGVHAFLRYTRPGKAMRALADNPDLARVTGIDVDRMVVYVWLMTGALVTVSGLLLSLVQNNQMNANMGFAILIALFASVILGGIGSAYGAMLGGFLVGIAMKTSALWIGIEYQVAAAFILLILVLFVRPQGLLGVKA
jgi:neutral amino acid transport system permease protein